MSVGLWERRYPHACISFQSVAKAKGRSWLLTDPLLMASRIRAWWPCGQNHRQDSVSLELGISLKPESCTVRRVLTKEWRGNNKTGAQSCRAREGCPAGLAERAWPPSPSPLPLRDDTRAFASAWPWVATEEGWGGHQERWACHPLTLPCGIVKRVVPL